MRKCVCFISALLLPALLVAQHIIHVPLDKITIQAAVDAAGYGDTILVAPGTYSENIIIQGNVKTITLASHFLVSGNESDISNTIIDAGMPVNLNFGMGILIKNQDSTLDTRVIGFTIINGTGYYKTYGGGIFSTGATPTIEYNRIMNCSITGTQPNGAGIRIGSGLDTTRFCHILHNVIEDCTINSALVGWGAGISLGFTNADVEHNQIQNNLILGDSATECGGAGIFYDVSPVFHFPHLIIKNNVLTSNAVLSGKAAGAGIYIAGGGGAHTIATIEGNTITQNITSSFPGAPDGPYAAGGGICMLSPAEGTIISGNTISSNIARNCSVYCQGGGIYIERNAASLVKPVPVIEKNMITGNTADEGGGIYSEHIGINLVNNFISGNQAESQAGALYILGPSDYNQATQIINNTITSNIVSAADGQAGSMLINGVFNVLLMNNIFYDNQAALTDEIFIPFITVEMYYNDINTAEVEGSWNGIYNFYADPEFIDGMIWDCLDPGPCWDSGKDSIIVFGKAYFAPMTSMGDIPRPLDNGFDLGAWEVEMCYEGSAEIPARNFNFKVRPNPVSDQATFEYELPESSLAKLMIFNLLGQQVGLLVNEFQTAGRHQVNWRTAGLQTGIYYYRLSTGYNLQFVTGRLIIAR